MSDNETSTLAEIQEQLEKLMEANAERTQQLATNFRAALQPSDIVSIRLNSLITVLLDEPNRLRVEVMTQTMLGHILDSVMNEASEAKTRNSLLEGVPGVDPNAQQAAPSPFLRQ